jgi:hypothetical protein
VIGSIPPGSHDLTLSGGPGYAEVARRVTIERAETAQLSIDVPSSFPRKVRTVVTWGGVGVATLGGAVTALAIEQAATAPKEALCLPSCPSQLLKAGADRSHDPTAGSGNGHGPAIAPIGYSVALTGVVWALATGLLGDEDAYPWIEVGAGLAIGIASWLLSVALIGKSATP